MAERREVRPHRLCFAAGALILVLASLWWAAVLLAPASRPSGMPPAAVHALVMTFGFFPMFFAGFIFSTGLKWMHVPACPPAFLAPATVAFLLGWAAVGCAVALQRPPWLAGGLTLAAGAWAWMVAGLALLSTRRAAAPSGHVTLIALAGAVGAVAMGAAAVASLLERWALVVTLARASVWGFVGLTFGAAAHRMVPFISAAPVRRLEVPWPGLSLAGLGLAFLANAVAQLLPAAARLAAAIDLCVGAVLVVFALRWPFVQSLRPRMLRMLYAGFLWLGASLVLTGLGGGRPGNPWGSAPLHAFTLGFLGTTMLAMLSRVIATGAGRTVVVDALLWALFWALQAAAVLRVVGPVVGLGAAVVAAGLLWAAIWLVWALRHGRWLGAGNLRPPAGR
ncbi:NnrS family protein [Caldimonas brevitalea]|uniref:NnrS family protein n=1 Tax=Caldimonas brevitalea TaxID=413882 RepID=A0A0G3BN55_9BURK|nr:NnrS family protein [Caldimonas brevitalea]AKJ30884.1 hypothetical protein AAW51_4193 [Caldimonas brevitalea]